MAQAKNGDTVRVHYTGKLTDGTVFDSSEGGEPLVFVLGEGEVIPGFERAVLGMNPGESKTETIPSADAYGDYEEELLLEVERNQFPPELNLEPGERLAVQTEDGHEVPVVVTAVSESTVTLDANHPLAGQDLVFDIELVGIG